MRTIILLMMSFTIVACKAADEQGTSGKSNESISIPSCIRNHVDSILDSSYSKTYTIDSMKYSNEITIYILENQYAPGFWGNYIFASNGSGSCSRSPIFIESTWIRNNESKFKPKQKLLKQPVFSFSDINNNGVKEVTVFERAHNGTVYNALLRRYYEVRNNLKLKLIFVLETKTIHPMENCIIERTMENYTVSVFAECVGVQPKEVGSYSISWDNESNPIIESREALNDYYENILVTGSNTPEEVFVTKGY